MSRSRRRSHWHDWSPLFRPLRRVASIRHRYLILFIVTLGLTGGLIADVASASGGTTVTLTASVGATPSTVLTVAAGSAVTYQATVTPIPDGGAVTFSDGNGVIDGCADVNLDTTTGVATCQQTYTDGGTETVTADYAGDFPLRNNYSGSTSDVATVVVNGASAAAGDPDNPTYTTSDLTLSPAPASIDSPETYVASIDPVPDGGTVEFSNPATGTLPGCDAVPVDTTNGTATCTVTVEAAGAHVIIADYSGDAGFQPSGSVIEAVNLGIAQAITFTSSPTSSVLGGTYTVTANGGASGNPVVFSIDPSSSDGTCTAGDTNGAMITFTGVGSCVIDANQIGDAKYSSAPQVEQSTDVLAAAGTGNSGASVGTTSGSTGSTGVTGTSGATGATGPTGQ